MAKNWQDLSALVVGFGSIGRRHTRILRELGVKDIRLCELDKERRDAAASEFAVESSYDNLNDALAGAPETVFLCSPTGLHVEQATAAIEAGADVFMEKPLSVSMDGVDALDTLAKERNRTVMLGHCFRFHDGLRKAKQWVDEGRIGRIVSIRCVFGEYIPEVMPNYKNMYISQYSGVYELMHDIDLAIWFAESAPRTVLGIDGKFADAEMTSPDLAEMIIKFQNNIVASVHLDFFERARHRQIELLGTQGTIYVELAKWDECTVSIYEAASGQWVHEVMKTERDDMFRAEDSLFLQAVETRSPVPIDITEGRKAVEVMLAAQESSKTCTAIKLS